MAQTTFDPFGWLIGFVGTGLLGWLGLTSKTVGDHSVEIAVLKANQQSMKESLDRLEDHFGTKPKE